MQRWEARRLNPWDSHRRPLVFGEVQVLDVKTGSRETVDLLVRDGVVRRIGAGDVPADAWVFDLPGRLVVPGFVDPHVHLREPGDEDAETITSGSAAAARGGYTAICSMANTHPPIDDPQSVRFVLERARDAGLTRVHPLAAVSLGLEGKQLTEMFDLAAAGAVAFSDDGHTIMDANLMRRALEYAGMLDKVVVAHAEDLHLKGSGVVHEGFMSTKLGLRPVPRAAEEVIVARDIRLVQHTSGRLHVAHVSCAESVEMIRAAQARGLRVTGEVTPHHLLFTDRDLATYDPNFKMAPPLREDSDRMALIQGLRDGALAAVATDHAPHTEIVKDVEFDAAPNGVIGLETAFPALYTGLVLTGELELHELVRAMSVGAAGVFDLPHSLLEDGAAANLTVLDLEAVWDVQGDDFVGLSANCPWIGRSLTGLPVATVSEGRVVHNHPTVIPRDLAPVEAR